MPLGQNFFFEKMALISWGAFFLLACMHTSHQKEENIFGQRVLQLWIRHSEMAGCHKDTGTECVYDDDFDEELLIWSVSWRILDNHGCQPMSTKVQFIDSEPVDHINGAESCFDKELVQDETKIQVQTVSLSSCLPITNVIFPLNPDHSSRWIRHLL